MSRSGHLGDVNSCLWLVKLAQAHLMRWSNSTQTVFLKLTSWLVYHSRQNNYRCKSSINSKTISVRKKELIFAELILTSQILQIFIECRITVGCPPCTYTSIHHSPDEDTLKITVGCPTSTYPSIRNKNLQTCLTPWSTRETRGLWARPRPRADACACAFTSDPQPGLFEFTSL